MAFTLTDNPFVVLSIGCILAYLIWSVAYNLYFHPLATIPGPLLPAVTRWYEIYFDCICEGGGQYPFQLKRLHEKYGPIIRPVPDQVHISDPQFLDTIYASRNRNQLISKGLDVDQSVAGAEAFKLHRLRREALNPYFSQKAVLSLHSLIAQKKDKVVAILDEGVQSGDTLNLSDVFFAYANDLVRAFSFGSDSNLLSDLPDANAQRTNLARLLTGVHIQKHFTAIFRIIGRIAPVLGFKLPLPPGGTYILVFKETKLMPTVVDLVKFKQRARQDIQTVLADKNNDKKRQHSIFYELRDSPLLPPEEKTVNRLQDEATIIVMAGTESTAKSLGIATVYILRQPQIRRKLRNEIFSARGVPSKDVPLSKLLTFPYLSAVILEANRLSFGVTARMPRYSPDETLTYNATSGPYQGNTYTLPPGTVMSSLTYCIHTDEALFPDPLHFDPDRWIISPKNREAEVSRRKRSMIALGKGHRKCIGIHVANAAISMALAEMVEYEMELVETDESDVEFQRDFQISHPREGSLGIQVIINGKRDVCK